jgi:transcriptional regulator
MYIPAAFEERSVAVLHGLMRAHPFGLLVTSSAEVLEADALPLLLDADRGVNGTLRGHVARANPVWREAADRPVLLVFQGADGYVSPGWYASKADGGKVVPTWNYLVVQARGRLRVVDDAGWLRRLVGDLTRAHESARPEPWAVEDAPADYIERMLGAIVGIEIVIDSLRGKWKLSQNRSEADRRGVQRGLRDEAGNLALADDMATPRPAP